MLLKEKNLMGWSTELFYCDLKKLKRMIPKVAIKPIRSFFLVSLSFESLTPEKKIPTMITDSKLHDLAMTTAGNDE